jgi:hypothetical protein
VGTLRLITPEWLTHMIAMRTFLLNMKKFSNRTYHVELIFILSVLLIIVSASNFLNREM